MWYNILYNICHGPNIMRVHDDSKTTQYTLSIIIHYCDHVSAHAHRTQVIYHIPVKEPVPGKWSTDSLVYTYTYAHLHVYNHW